jgi:ABC-type uncharacterized transport system permease subunit
MLLIFKRLWQVNWAEHWQYRANLMMYMLYGLVSPVVYLAVWTTVANSQGSVGGLTANDFVTYYLTLLIVDQIISDISQYYLADKILDGTLSGDLIRPIHPVLTQTLIATSAQKALSFIALLPAWIILALRSGQRKLLLLLPDGHSGGGRARSGRDELSAETAGGQNGFAGWDDPR